MSNLTVQGLFLLDVDAVALNNAGGSKVSNNDNVTETKKVYKDNKPYAYISGQALGAWLRETLQKSFGWALSPILRESKTAFTAANPILYPDDDTMGYMKAAKDVVVDVETGTIVLDGKGREKMEDVTVTRRSPLFKSAIVSVGPVSIARNWSSMSRQDGDAVPYFKEEYSAIMKGQFSLDLRQVGTFATYNRTGFKNLTEKMKEYALENGCTLIPDPFALDGKGLPHKLVQMPIETRIQRSTDIIQAFKVLSGGAMQTNNMADITPKFIVLALMKSGNHPFGHFFAEKIKNVRVDSEDWNETDNAIDKFKFIHYSIESILEVLKDYKDQIVGTVFIGKRSGFLDDYTEQLKSLEKLDLNYSPPVKFGSIGDAIDGFCELMKIKMQ